MPLQSLLKRAFALGPVWFGLAFIAPLVAQTLDAQAVEIPLGLSTVHVGLATGLVLGTIATWRGRWV